MALTTDLQALASATLMAAYRGNDVPAWLLRRVEQGLGGVCLFASNDIERAPGALHDVRADVIVATDEEGGDVTRLHATTGSPVPGNAALGAIDDTDMTHAVARAIGAELRSAGIDVDLAPVADVNANPANPVIGTRSFGSDAALVSRHVAAFVAGLQAAGLAASTKHFPGHGDTEIDSHLATPRVSSELAPFRAAIEAGTASVMVGHLVVDGFGREPATMNPRVMTGLLRGELGFDGAVVTDALEMGGAGGRDAIPMTVLAALNAGADLCCLGALIDDDIVGACVDAVTMAVRRGELAEDRLVDAAARVARLRQSCADIDATLDVPAAADVGAIAARKALRVDPTVALPVRGAHVVELECPPTIAAGPVPWGVGEPLLASDTTATAERLDNGAFVDGVLARAAGRPLVIVVRDAHWHAGAARLLADLRAARDDAIVVDMGWPASQATITTFGASRASGGAVARLLLEGN